MVTTAQLPNPLPTSVSRKPTSYGNINSVSLTSSWQLVATVTDNTKALYICPIASATTFDIEIMSVDANTSAPTAVYGIPIFGGYDGGGSDPLLKGDIYLKSATNQTALIRSA